MKKLLIAIVGILLVLSVTVVIISSRNKSPASPISQNSLTPTVSKTPSVKLKKYTDSSGFGFEYPETLILTPKEPLPQNTYAFIELTAPKEQATITLKVEDSSVTKLNSLVTATTSSSLKLADMAALQFENSNKKTTIALDNGVLFTVTLTPASASMSWLNAYDNIISSFVFSQPASNNDSSSQPVADDVIYEGEETVE